MKIGTLKEISGTGKRQFQGAISTLNLDLTILLKEVVIDAPNAPNFTVLAKSENGKECEIGAAWRKTPVRYAEHMDEFLSLTLDDPSFDQRLNIAAFPKGNGEWDITWRRRQSNQAAETA